MPEYGGLSQTPRIIARTKLDGVYYANFFFGGQKWRLGSLTPNWEIKVAAAFERQNQQVLGEEGIWICPDLPPGSLAVMCCGLGSAWPGMGRALYNFFPAAREIMDEIANLADWDILELLDCAEMDEISRTRWQIPYLFMLERAQWQIFSSLGLNPNIICGHSLGELIALCLGGIYNLQSAWYLLETRAEHMAEMEAKGKKLSGMLAVPAEETEISAILKEFPDLRVSNRNTLRQFVLSGPREQLLQARRQLRRSRIPAIMLNMDLAFHNPAMRILRNMSLRRLNGLKMSAPGIAVLSCVDASPYPASQKEICERIADLDENAVDWVRLIGFIEKAYPGAVYLELGPQETLCGLTCELAPQAPCIPADRRGHEVKAMRTALARLYAYGFLDFQKIAANTASSKDSPAEIAETGQTANQQEPMPPILTDDAQIVIDILARACNLPKDAITPQMDLRQDLALHSSQFPWLMLEAERRLGKPVVLENLFRLVTVADLVQFLCGPAIFTNANQQAQKPPRPEWLAKRRPLGRFELSDEGLKPLPLNSKGVNSGIAIFRRFAAQDNSDWIEPVKEWLAKIAKLPALADGEKPRAVAWLDNGQNASCADMLTLELNYGQEEAVVWAPKKDGQILSRFAVGSPKYRELFPNEQPPENIPGDVIQLLRHFSCYTTPSLAGHGQNALFTPLAQYEPREEFADNAWLPLSEILRTMVLAADIAFPWLEPIGFADIRFFRLPAIPQGITRECPIAVTGRLGIYLEGVPSRLCKIAIAADRLAPTGRKVVGSLPLSDGFCILASKPAPFPPVWRQFPPCRNALTSHLGAFYGALAFSASWQLLTEIKSSADNKTWEARMTAPGRDGPYSAAKLADACLQAAMFALALRHGAPRDAKDIAVALEPWRFASIGFIRYDAAVSALGQQTCLQLAISWEDSNLTRFDAQAFDATGNLLLTIHSLEFDRIDLRSSKPEE